MPRILLIDDDDSLRTFTRKILEDAGFHVAEAADGRQGLRLFRVQGADVLLCDLFMPDIDGLEVISLLRHEAPNIPIVVMSDGDWKRRLDQLAVAKELGAAQVLAKPFDSSTVVDALVKALRNDFARKPSLSSRSLPGSAAALLPR